MKFEEAQAQIKKSQDEVAKAQQKIDDAESDIEAYQGDIVEIVEPFLPPYEEGQEPDDPPEYVVPGTWSCPDERNPAGTCVYDDRNDGCHDFCRFCGHPEERK